MTSHAPLFLATFVVAALLSTSSCGKSESKTQKMPPTQNSDDWGHTLRQQVSPLLDSGEYAKAAHRLEEELDAVSAKYGANDERMLIVYGMLADVLAESAKPERSAAVRVKQLELLDARNAPRDEIVRVLGKLYSSYITAKRADLAETYIDRQLELLRAQHGADSKEVADKMMYVGALLAMAGDHAIAVEYFKHALAVFEKTEPGSDDARKAAAHLLTSLEKLGRHEEISALKKRYDFPD